MNRNPQRREAPRSVASCFPLPTVPSPTPMLVLLMRFRLPDTPELVLGPLLSRQRSHPVAHRPRCPRKTSSAHRPLHRGNYANGGAATCGICHGRVPGRGNKRLSNSITLRRARPAFPRPAPPPERDTGDTLLTRDVQSRRHESGAQTGFVRRQRQADRPRRFSRVLFLFTLRPLSSGSHSIVNQKGPQTTGR